MGSTCAVSDDSSVVAFSGGIARVWELRSNSLAIAEGLTAVAAGSTDWALGPTWAGATELALIAAQISNAERTETTIFSANHCGNPPNQGL